MTANKTDIAFITGSDLPIPDQETHLIVAALESLGRTAEVINWNSDADWASYPLIVLRSPWDYIKRLPEFMTWARRIDGLTRLVNPLPVIEWNVHKRYLLELAQNGVPIVPTIILEKGSDPFFPGVIEGSGSRELVVKPAIANSALGALRGEAGDPNLISHLSSQLALGDVVVQPFVPEVTQSGEASLVFFGNRFSHAVQKQAQAGEYRVQSEYGGTVHPYTPSRAELEVAAAALAAAPAMTTYARIDLVRQGGKPAVMELELIEPELFLPYCDLGAKAWAETIYALGVY